MLKQLRLFAFFLTVGITSQAHGFVAIPSLTINEIFDSNSGYGAYSVTNTSGFEIFAFAVGSNSSNYAETSYRNLWNANVVSEAEWNAGTLYFGDPNVNTSDYPFQNYFAGYTRVNAYSVNDDFNIQIGETTGYEFSYLALEPNSSFIALYHNNGGIGVISGQASVVPVPTAALLFGSGLIALLGFRRHKN